MTLNKRDYLKQVFSLDLTYESEKMLSARREFLSGHKQDTLALTMARRQEVYWELQDFRYEFWGLSAKQRENKIEELSKQAPANTISSLNHLQQISGIEAQIKLLEEDQNLDPVFVERLKSRILWSNNAVPAAMELRTAIPAKTRTEFEQIQESAVILQIKYPELACFASKWLAMIETSEVTLLPRVEHVRNQSEEPLNYFDPDDHSFDEFVRTEIETNRQAKEEEEKKIEKRDAQEQTFAAFLLLVLSFALLLLYLFSS